MFICDWDPIAVENLTLSDLTYWHGRAVMWHEREAKKRKQAEREAQIGNAVNSLRRR